MEQFLPNISLLLIGAVATGLGAGVVAGLFGVGGGIVIVPALLLLFNMAGLPGEHLMQMAVGTSLATIVITNTMATWKQQQRQSVYWLAVRYYTPGILVGAWLGALLAVRLDGGFLQTLFGLFEIVVGLRMVSSRQAADDRRPVSLGRLLSPVIGVAIGTISSLFGIGGGTLSVPALTLLSHIPIRIAVGSSSAIGIFLAISGALGFILAGWDSSLLPVGSWGYVIPEAFFGIITGTLLTTPLGVKLAHSIPQNLLKKSFGYFLVLVGVKLIVG
jgi:uncharacterized protein